MKEITYEEYNKMVKKILDLDLPAEETLIKLSEESAKYCVKKTDD